MRLVFAALIYNFGYTLSIRLAAHPDPVGPATWSALGVGLFALSISLALELPLPRTATLPLKSELLEMLPLSRLSKLLCWACRRRSWRCFSAWGWSFRCSVSSRPEVPFTGSLALAFSLFVTFSLAGASLGKLLRLVLSPLSRLAPDVGVDGVDVGRHAAVAAGAVTPVAAGAAVRVRLGQALLGQGVVDHDRPRSARCHCCSAR